MHIIQYNWNIHSLKYAFITHLLRLGVESAIISKINRSQESKLDNNIHAEKTAELK